VSGCREIAQQHAGEERERVDAAVVRDGVVGRWEAVDVSPRRLVRDVGVQVGGEPKRDLARTWWTEGSAHELAGEREDRRSGAQADDGFGRLDLRRVRLLVVDAEAGGVEAVDEPVVDRPESGGSAVGGHDVSEDDEAVPREARSVGGIEDQRPTTPRFRTTCRPSPALLAP
jgi:hypothetical protein